MHNSDITIGENVTYFMHKYKIVYNDWFNDLSNIYNRTDNQIQLITQLDDICLAGATRELCEARNSGVVQFVDCNQMCNMIDYVVCDIVSSHLYKVVHIYVFCNLIIFFIPCIICILCCTGSCT